MPQVVVGAAIVRDRRVLAARRTTTRRLTATGEPAVASPTAGGWEFPGGKVEPGESEVEALVRECREEIAVTVRVGVLLGPDQVLPTGAVLRVYRAELVTGEPRALADHDEVRWLSVDELDDVAWLSGDRPFVDALRPLL